MKLGTQKASYRPTLWWIKKTREGGDILKIFLGIFFTSTWSVEIKQLTEVQWAPFNTNDAKIESPYFSRIVTIFLNSFEVFQII